MAHATEYLPAIIQEKLVIETRRGTQVSKLLASGFDVSFSFGLEVCCKMDPVALHKRGVRAN